MMNDLGLPPLNLPPYDHRLQRQADGKVYILDPLRRKYLLLTPEEWVRQHVVQLLLAQGFPKGLIGLEQGLKVHRLQKRTDILVYDRQGRPYFLIECKAPQVALKEQVFEQIGRYNMALKAPYLGITNGMQHYFCRIDFAQGRYLFLPGLPPLP